MPDTYKITRMYFSDDHNTQVIKRGLTLEEAQAWCADPETSSSTATSPAAVKRTETKGPGFDGYTDEEN